MEYCLVMTTTADEAEAKTLGRLLLNAKLAACVQIFPVGSMYWWNGKIQEGVEQILLIKTKITLYSEVEKMLVKNHSYKTPEIVRIPLAGGSANYFRWIETVTQQPDRPHLRFPVDL